MNLKFPLQSIQDAATKIGTENDLPREKDEVEISNEKIRQEKNNFPLLATSMIKLAESFSKNRIQLHCKLILSSEKGFTVPQKLVGTSQSHLTWMTFPYASLIVTSTGLIEFAPNQIFVMLQDTNCIFHLPLSQVL